MVIQLKTCAAGIARRFTVLQERFQLFVFPLVVLEAQLTRPAAEKLHWRVQCIVPRTKHWPNGAYDVLDLYGEQPATCDCPIPWVLKKLVTRSTLCHVQA